MKLENQVCSFELAKRLKELGVRQESNFYWVCWGKAQNSRDCAFTLEYIPYPKGTEGFYEKRTSAFTVAELGEMLPASFYSGRMVNGKFNCFDYIRGSKTLSENTEADARAKMLIHLIEQGIVKKEMP